MNRVALANGGHLAIEHDDKKVRLVIYAGSVEKVCRKERVKTLLKFVQNTDVHLFKGRLQLLKQNGGIAILVKGTEVGEITTEDFVNCVLQAETAFINLI